MEETTIQFYEILKLPVRLDYQVIPNHLGDLQ